MTQSITKEFKLLTLVKGQCFGEDNIVFSRPNSYSIKVESKQCVLYKITSSHSSRFLNSLKSDMALVFQDRLVNLHNIER